MFSKELLTLKLIIELLKLQAYVFSKILGFCPVIFITKGTKEVFGLLIKSCHLVYLSLLLPPHTTSL